MSFTPSVNEVMKGPPMDGIECNPRKRIRKGRKDHPFTKRPLTFLNGCPWAIDIIKKSIKEAGDKVLWNYWCADGWNEKMYDEMAKNVFKHYGGISDE